MNSVIGNCEGCDTLLWSDGRAGRHGEMSHKNGMCFDCQQECEIADLKRENAKLKEGLQSGSRRLFNASEGPSGTSVWTDEAKEIDRLFKTTVRLFLKVHADGVDLQDFHYVLTSAISSEINDVILKRRLGD